MTFLSLNWFKEKIKNTVEKIVEKRVDLAVEQMSAEEKLSETFVKPYKKLKLVNDSLTVVLYDDSILCKVGVSKEEYDKVISAKTVSEIQEIMFEANQLQKSKEEQQELQTLRVIKNNIDTLKDLKSFTLKDDCVYLTGIERSLPKMLIEKFCKIVAKYKHLGSLCEIENALLEDEEFIAHKRFFMWCCLNPRAEVADTLYDFLTKNSFRITKQGFFAALRNVVTVSQDTTLVDFISNAYNKVKAVWKKNPDNYRVVKLDSGELSLEKTSDYPNGEILGNLTTLYLDLPNLDTNRYTDDWTKTFDIRIGKVVNMPLEKCDWSTQDCAAAGLHFTSDQIHYVGCGDQSILVLINPMKVVGIGEHKGRCYEYLPIMTVPREEATQLLHDLDFDTIELDDSYAIRELEDLAEKVKNGFAQESKKYTFNLPSISTKEIDNIVNNLERIKDDISKRIVNID